MRIFALACLLLAVPCTPAVAKLGHTTVCGADGCKNARQTLSGVAALRGDVSAPRPGRFFVLRIEVGDYSMCMLHERSRGLVRALDDGTAATLGRSWRRLTAEQRAHYALATARRPAFSSTATALAARTPCST
jgi:hypothetical protein